MKDDFIQHIKDAESAVMDAALEPGTTNEEIDRLSEVSKELQDLRLSRRAQDDD